MLFKYTAIKIDGGRYNGTRESYDRFSLYEELKNEGETLLTANEIIKSKFEIILPFINTVPEHQKIIFTRNLGAMLKAGLSLAKCLDILEKQIANSRMKKIIQSLQREIKKGTTLSQACEAFPDVFPKLFTSMVRAGEESGKLSEALKTIADQMEGVYKLKQKIQGAMIYPSIILTVMVAIGIMMMVYVVPGITATFKDLKIELPLMTKILIGTSDFLKNNLSVSLILIVGFIAVLYLFYKSRIGKRIFDFIILRLPTIGQLVKETNAARITRTISSLLSSGVPYSEAVFITRDVVQNSYYKDILSTAISVVEKGGTISSVFLQNEKLCPLFVGEMAVVGEETGKLPEMFLEVAVFYEESVDQKTKDMATIIEPVLMVIIGLAVGFFALAMIKPIYSLMDSV